MLSVCHVPVVTERTEQDADPRPLSEDPIHRASSRRLYAAVDEVVGEWLDAGRGADLEAESDQMEDEFWESVRQKLRRSGSAN